MSAGCFMRATDVERDAVFHEVIEKQVATRTGWRGNPYYAAEIGLTKPTGVTSSPASATTLDDDDKNDDVMVTSPADDNSAKRKTRQKRRSSARKSEENGEEVATEQPDKGFHFFSLIIAGLSHDIYCVGSCMIYS